MKVLLVSHNVMSRSDNMGKTLLSYFEDFTCDELAQFYIHSEVPTDKKTCRNYYRFTDIDAVKSLLPFKRRGGQIKEEDILDENAASREELGQLENVYQYGRNRSGLIYLMRNLAWNLSHWFTKDLKKWIDDFKPDVVFFAAGDYAFMYKIAEKIADYARCPLVLSCVDDYYIYNKNQNTFSGKLAHKQLMKEARRIFAKALFATAICENMADAYEKLFHKQCFTLYTGADKVEGLDVLHGSRISYIGNLGYDRHLQLIDMGRALQSLGRKEEPLYIDVYSAEKNQDVLKTLTKENGIRFHGRIPADEVLEVMEESMAVIHTESFDEDLENQVRFSVSTKIAESLLYGPCLIAYGAKGIASFDYLREHNAAYVISSKEELTEGLQKVIENRELREKIVENARKLAEINHRSDVNAKKVRRWLEEYVSVR